MSFVSVLAVFVIIGLIAFSGNNSVAASQDQKVALRGGTMTSGGYPAGDDVVRKSFEIHQAKEGQIFNDLHFIAWQKEDWIKINGWTIAITHFTEGTSYRTTSPANPSDPDYSHAVQCDFKGAEIPYCTWLTIDITFWLTDRNTIRLADMWWTKDGKKMVELPSPAVNIATPVSAQAFSSSVMTQQSAVAASISSSISATTKTSSDQLVAAYMHLVTLSNDSTYEELLVKDLKIMISPDNVKSLGDINFSNAKAFDDVVIPPGKSAVVKVYTDKPYWDLHLYLNYELFDTANMKEAVFRNVRFDHPVFQVPTPQ
jgi:hypothetical protein